MKLSKPRLRKHAEACELVEQFHRTGKPLKQEDREFILDHWEPRAEHAISWIDAFFTPRPLAGAMMIETVNNFSRESACLDLCAGIGSLAYTHWKGSQWDEHAVHYTCLERNPNFVHVGQAVLPEAEWITGDVMDHQELLGDRRFDEFLSNPPFGKSGKLALEIIEIGAGRCTHGTVIVPHSCLDWTYSGNGRRGFESREDPKIDEWKRRTGIYLAPNCGIDTTEIEEADFKDTKIIVEIANLEDWHDYYGEPDDDLPVSEPEPQPEPQPTTPLTQQQLDLFAA